MNYTPNKTLQRIVKNTNANKGINTGRIQSTTTVCKW